MKKIANVAGAAAMALATLGSAAVLTVATPAAAASGFQNSCSNIAFGYGVGGVAAVTAFCLRADGSPNASALAIAGISNQNGVLIQGTGVSTFQKSCGNIQIVASASGVTLSALCRNSSGGSNPTSLPINNIGNNNGTLTY